MNDNAKMYMKDVIVNVMDRINLVHNRTIGRLVGKILIECNIINQWYRKSGFQKDLLERNDLNQQHKLQFNYRLLCLYVHILVVTQYLL
jgi:hypothetical protein